VSYFPFAFSVSFPPFPRADFFLEASDDDESPSPPTSSLRAKESKGKSKAKIVEEKKPALSSEDALSGEMWVEQYAPHDRVRIIPAPFFF
jgi:hypothetical protein